MKLCRWLQSENSIKQISVQTEIINQSINEIKTVWSFRRSPTADSATVGFRVSLWSQTEQSVTIGLNESCGGIIFMIKEEQCAETIRAIVLILVVSPDLVSQM